MKLDRGLPGHTRLGPGIGNGQRPMVRDPKDEPIAHCVGLD
jgi:hypothetical protein